MTDAGKTANRNFIDRMLARIQKKKNSKKGMPTNTAGTTVSTLPVGATYNISNSNTVLGQGGAGGVMSANNVGVTGQVIFNANTAAWTTYAGGYGHTVTGTTMAYKSPSTVMTLNGANSKELVRIEKDGSVKWAEDATVDEAATAFAKTLTIGAERSAGITYGVKQRMRDAVFEEMISMAKEKGSLTPDDLTYLWQAAKIMDKLKGATE